MKTIDGKLHTRLDFASRDPLSPNRSVITDGVEAVLFETATQQVLYRTTVGAAYQQTATIPSRIMGRIDPAAVQAELKRLSFDIIADDIGRYLMCSAPASYLAKLPTTGNGSVTAMRLIFDLTDQVLSGSEQVQVQPDGETITTDTNNQYQIVDDQPVLTGEVIIEHHDVPGSLPVGSDMLPQVIDPSTIPDASQDDIQNAQQQGGVIAVDPPIGDRTDPDYTLTTIISYDNISLNDVQDSDLRILLSGGKK
jgi:hypothetical protein